MSWDTKAKFYAIAFIIFGAGMGFVHYLLKGVNEQFGMGVAAGLFIGAGLIFLLSRDARNLS